MAIVYPSLSKIRAGRLEPTEGEWHLIQFLEKNLDDTYEVFFQPFINGDRPDVVIMRKGGGVYIIEVKDWDLRSYRLRADRAWEVRDKEGHWQIKKSPIEQVKTYKDNFYNLHIAGFPEELVDNKKKFALVNCGVYFHRARTKDVNKFVRTKFGIDGSTSENTEKYQKYLPDLYYFDLIGFDTLTKSNFDNIMRRRHLSKRSYIFDENLYKLFKRQLQPPLHRKEEGSEIEYSDDQKKVIKSEPGKKQKFRGIAGGGKTLCLAKRAVNAHMRHKGEVLILTYNISLRNYIHDKINEVREEFWLSNFYIIHYHQFFMTEANNYELKAYFSKEEDDERDSDFYNISFFESVKDEIRKYKTILIDEIQDYETVWIDIILKYFLEEGGEFVVCGDERQNIYARNYDITEKKPNTRIQGNWNNLKVPYRNTDNIRRLSYNFQQSFLKGKYELDDNFMQGDLWDRSDFRYYFLNRFDASEIVKIYKDLVQELDVHENDVCFQSAKVEPLREIDYEIRKDSVQKTNTMFESQEDYERIKKIFKDSKLIRNKCEKIRRNKKFNFWNNAGLVKLSTIHSFKGWEVDTLFLIIESEEDSSKTFTTDEMIYTAITRCINNLIVININNSRYHNFFVQAKKEDFYVPF